ncbi:ABC transporter ATP-binding protein [Cellulomonas carbonis]|uniref:ABC transporter ATP-binding protein n=1 Tax=Cellulomonas carbonis T26 TaxID=947969 RepID=A0A0A0BQZ2_9CELL|nr:ATP-binding cassette domain-containing protein [Cellulomonas carbonis]KGM10888.1 ABC transporter ATP-binding protein [Cellulomonas carbonis T26]GGC00295.1 ABC transporter ATP-binding protein [Cellulomonas carbonis]
MLVVDGIRRSFGDRLVLDDVGFTVERGRLTGFVGGNGAGKTTTMRIILGVLSADAGTVTLDGTRLGPDQRRLFGYMPEERGLYPKMKVAEQIAYLARLHGVDRTTATERAHALLERLGLGARADEPLENLSLGNQQRAQIAAALVHEPEVLVLDEPFSGLDPLAVDVVVGVLAEYAAGGAPVLFSSHQLDVVERLCDDLVIIADGRIRAAGPREQLRAAHSEPRWEIDSAGDVGWLRGVPGVEVLDFDGGWAVFTTADDAVAQGVLRRALDSAPVASFAPVRSTLAEIFREVVADRTPEEAVR